MDHAFFIGPDGFIQEVYQYKSIQGNEDSISVLTGIQAGMEVWEEKSAADYVRKPPGEGFYKPKWNGVGWVEGLTQSEIDAIRSQPTDKTEMEILKEENTLLKAQIQAASDRSDFHEELIAEMAMLVYS